jgi:hypothetical protein
VIAVLADQRELPAAAAVWGRENRVLPPDGRSALCWLTLARLLGWESEVRRPADGADLGADVRCALVARDPDTVTPEEVAALTARLEREPMLLIAPAPSPGTPLAELTGAATGEMSIATAGLRWHGPGGAREWEAWPTVAVTGLELLEGSDPGVSRPALPRRASGQTPRAWASIGDAPLVVAREVGNGVVATLAAHPVELIDAAPSGSGLLKYLLTRGIPGPLEWLELEGWVIPRCDDAGSCSSAHLDEWAHRSLTAEEWRTAARDLAEREARITVGYVPGWVDDGDPGRGELRVGGKPVNRDPGRVHPSSRVTYESESAPQDNPAALRGIQDLRAAGAGEVELHGFTHLRPIYGGGDGPYAAWAAAENRHYGVGWYRELEGLEPPPGEPGPVAHGLGAFTEQLRAAPVALCCPGHACSPPASESAARSGLELIAAESVALRLGERLAWCDHISNPYADGAGGPWLESGLPVVACLHDRDLVVNGTGWLAERLDEWSAHGATRFADLRELAAALAAEPIRPLPRASRPG